MGTRKEGGKEKTGLSSFIRRFRFPLVPVWTDRCGWELWPISLMREQTGSHYCPAVFILKFVHCYSKDVVSTRAGKRERGKRSGERVWGTGKLNKTTKQRIGNEVIERLASVKVRFCSHFSFSPSPCLFPAPVPHFSNILQQLFKNRFSTCTDIQLSRL